MFDALLPAMTFSLRFWGTRGSIPTPGESTVRYGGNTPCVEMRTAAGGLIILDAGTGIRALGRRLVQESNGSPLRGDIFVTHAHWDHIQGLPFFRPIFQPGNHFTIWSAAELTGSLERVVRDQMSRVVFPVEFDQLGATIDFRTIGSGPQDGGGYAVEGIPVCHPGGALGYRFTGRNGNGGALVYISDNEIGTSAADPRAATQRASLAAWMRGARILVHDTMYTADEYERHRGWGHSSYDAAVLLALEAGVEQLVLYHHKPERSDDELDRCVEDCRSLVRKRGGHVTIVAAAEGMELMI
ncbi:MAG: MBL fold metallo-hydrolase [Gemmatimonadaceae bacterium]